MNQFNQTSNRRTFLKNSLASGAAIGFGVHQLTQSSLHAATAVDRPKIGLIGAGWQPETKRIGRGIAIGKLAKAFADIAVICEVDSVAADFAHKNVGGGKSDRNSDYREVIDRDDIDAILIATPDHWHTKIAVEAMRAGKDVYCEKPATVTIAEGKLLCKVIEETGCVFQVGTQQRTENEDRFQTAVALVRQGRIGEVQRITIGLDPGWQGGPFKKSAPPKTLDWDRWLGPAPKSEYIPERVHRTFRWWFEYSGGKLTDWGAHHVDIAQWAIDQHLTGPSSISGTGKFHVDYEDGFPKSDDFYNTPSEFNVTAKFANDIEMVITSGPNGILFEGTKGRIFVNRGKLTGKPVEDLAKNPLPKDALIDVCNGRKPKSHMADFFHCMTTRETPISDMASHHRTLSTCHLANLTLRLRRELKWNAKIESFVDDDAANAFLAREYRDEFEIEHSLTERF